MATPDDREKINKIRKEQRFNEQCYLLGHIDKLVEFGSREEEKNRRNYKNYSIIQGRPNDISQVFTGKIGVEELFQLTPAQKALLVPKIRIFKVIYLNKEKTKTRDYEIIFRDHTTAKSIENITKTRVGRGDDVGLKSFSYESLGQNPAETGHVKCSLTLFFQNIGVLLGRTDSGVKYIDLIKHPVIENQTEKEKNKDSKNCLTPDGKETAPGEEEWDSKLYRIKAEIGWAVPTDPEGQIINKNLRRAIEKSKIVLFLSLKNHNIDFREDASVELSVEYIGALEGVLLDNKFDILQSAGERTGFGETADFYRKAIVQQQQKRLKSDDKKNILKKTEKEIVTDLLAQNLETKDKQVRYSNILDTLLKNRAMYYIPVEKDMLSVFSEGQEEAIKKLLQEKNQNGTRKYTEEDIEALRRETLRRRLVGKGKYKNPISVPNKNKSYQNKLDNFKKAISRSVGADTEDIQKRLKNKTSSVSSLMGAVGTALSSGNVSLNSYANLLKDATEESKRSGQNQLEEATSVRKLKSGVTPLYFFYFGDLIEYAASFIDEKNFRFLSGPITYTGIDGKRKNYNLADIPISLDLFMNWVKDNIVAKQREKYLIGDFINDIIKTLILPALGANCPFSDQQQRSHVTLNLFTIPGKGERGEKEPISKGRRIDVSRLDISPLLDRTIIPSSGLYHILYISAMNWDIGNLKGNYREDIKKGVYHIAAGQDKGLVKRIRFKKEDQPFVPEARVAAQSTDITQLRGLYNADVDMIGNTLFTPGQYVYIDTAQMGMSSPMKKNSDAALLGIGGYYLVTKYTHEISTDDYLTTLECKWQQTFNCGNESRLSKGSKLSTLYRKFWEDIMTKTKPKQKTNQGLLRGSSDEAFRDRLGNRQVGGAGGFSGASKL